MIRETLVRALSKANRVAKRCLGLESSASAFPATPDFLNDAEQEMRWTDNFRQGSLVFLLQHVTRGQGGLADVLYLGLELERQYGLDVSFVAPDGQNLKENWKRVHWTNAAVREKQFLGALDFAPEYVCATAWPTTYRARTVPSRHKLYFVQDYEPMFHRAGIQQACARLTYDQGYRIFTLGPWLARHLGEMHGVRDAIGMPFPVSDAADPGKPLADRKIIALYVQPDKEHRGTPLMLEVARRLSRAIVANYPGLELVLFGSADNEYLKPDFPCVMRGQLTEAELLDLFRNTRVGMCASFTNISLITFRFLAHGCVALDLNFPGVTANMPPAALPLVRCCEPLPAAMVQGCLSALSSDVKPGVQADVAQRLADGHSWKACAATLAPLFQHEPAMKRDGR